MSVSAKELKRRSRAILSGRYSLPMGAFAVSQVISTCISLPFDISLQSNPTVFQFIISELATAIISLLYIVLKGGQAYVHLNMAREKMRLSLMYFVILAAVRIVLSFLGLF